MVSIHCHTIAGTCPGGQEYRRWGEQGEDVPSTFACGFLSSKDVLLLLVNGYRPFGKNTPPHLFMPAQ